jgi:hypothetical protein
VPKHYARLKDRAMATMCLGANAWNGADVQLMDCGDPRAQLLAWVTGRFSLRAAPHLCFDVRDGGWGGTRLQVWECALPEWSNANQHFTWVDENMRWGAMCVGTPWDWALGRQVVGLADCNSVAGRRRFVNNLSGWV